VVGLIDWWAVVRPTTHDDAYSTLGNNYYAYHAPSGRWTLIPWGPDQAFQGDEGLFDKIGGALTERCLEVPECVTRLEERIEAVVVTWEDSGFVDWAERETERIENDCRTDPRSEWGDYGCRDALIGLREWVAARPGVVRAELAAD
jgi:hypothetical protein